MSDLAKSPLPSWVAQFDVTKFDPLAAIGGQAALDALIADGAAAVDSIAVWHHPSSDPDVTVPGDNVWHKVDFSNPYMAYYSWNLKGGSGSDLLFIDNYFQSLAQLSVGDGNDVVVDLANAPFSSWGLISVYGDGGDDILVGPRLHGGNGADIVVGNGNAVILFGDDGNDVLIGAGWLYGGNGDDVLVGKPVVYGECNLDGGCGNDLLIGCDATNWYTPGSGQDSVIGSAGRDIVCAGYSPSDGDYADAGSVTYFRTGGGFDTVYMQSRGLVVADLSAETVTSSDAGTVIADGIEAAQITSARSIVIGTNDNEVAKINYSDSVWVAMKGGNDTVRVGSQWQTVPPSELARVTVDLGAGDDTLQAQLVFKTLGRFVGGSGSDTVSFNDRYCVTADLSKGTAALSNGSYVALSGFENLSGSNANDQLTGDARANKLEGLKGDDIIRGGGGKDTLKGGKGADTFVFEAADLFDAKGKAYSADRILDFDYTYREDRIVYSPVDKIDLRGVLNGLSFTSIDDVAHLSDSAGGSTLSIKVRGGFIDVAYIRGWHADTVSDHFKDGYLISH